MLFLWGGQQLSVDLLCLPPCEYYLVDLDTDTEQSINAHDPLIKENIPQNLTKLVTYKFSKLNLDLICFT
jgi:hypothetical protein